MRDLIEKFKKGWQSGLPETPCGLGSKLSNTQEIRNFISHCIKKYEIKSINDIGSGDLNWIKHIDLTGVDYESFDLVPRQPETKQFNIIEQIPPKADALLCVYVLNHLSKPNAKYAMLNLLKSDSKYLIITSYKNDFLALPFEFIESIEIHKQFQQNAFIGIMRINDD